MSSKNSILIVEDEMIIAAAAEEADGFVAGDVLAGEVGHVRLQFHLGECVGNLQRSPQLEGIGDRLEQRIDRRDADFREHRLAVGVGVENVRQGRSLLV